ncbi:UNVERIFIED_ORG: hypothetical protein M2348_002699 [Sphingomonas sp. R1F5B]
MAIIASAEAPERMPCFMFSSLSVTVFGFYRARAAPDAHVIVPLFANACRLCWRPLRQCGPTGFLLTRVFPDIVAANLVSIAGGEKRKIRIAHYRCHQCVHKNAPIFALME